MSMSRSAHLAATIVLAAVVAGTARGVTTAPRVAVRSGCGIERWPIKTLSDPLGRVAAFTLRGSSVQALRRLRVPVAAVGDRLRPVETTAYRLAATLVEMKIEEDGDVHLVIAQPGQRTQTMIVEFPSFRCTAGASVARRRQMRRARAALVRGCGPPRADAFTSINGRALITGVGFFDRLHGQTGVAPNGIELHPVLLFRGGCFR